MSQRRVPKPVPQRIALVTGKRSVSIPHVVIVGGGFGGLYTAKRLKYRPVRVTLIDRRNHHLWRIDSLSLAVHRHYKREQHSFSLFPCKCVPPAHRAGPQPVRCDTHPP
jgi:cation diffusion facilitator CzcD-associated flavoprotein CzcO